jgi:hypothetical protein
MTPDDQRPDARLQNATTPPVLANVGLKVAKTIEELLAEAKQKAKEGKEADVVVAELTPLVLKKTQAVDGYKKKYPDLLRRWNGQKAEILGLWRDIQCAYPTWAQIVRDVICPVFEEINAQEDKVTALLCPKGLLKEKPAAEAQAKADTCKARFDGWLAAEQRLTTSLDDVDKATAEIRKVFANPEERAISIYLLWWKVLPPHVSISPPDQALYIEVPADVRPRCLPMLARGWLYLIAPANYSDKIEEAHTDAATTAKIAKDKTDEFKAAPDDLAAETKRAADLNAAKDQTIKDKLKKVPKPAEVSALRDRDGG